MDEAAQKISEILGNLREQSLGVIFVTHKRADGDGLSACGAAEILFGHLGIPSVTVLCDEPEETYSSGPKNIVSSWDSLDISSFGAIFVFDVSGLSRTCLPENFRSYGIPIVNIDHHLGNELFGDINIVQPKASSASEIFYHLVGASELLRDNIGRDFAQKILTGILYDTDNLISTATTASTVEAVAHLVEHGASTRASVMDLTRSRTFEVMQIWGNVLKRMRRIPGFYDGVYSFLSVDDVESTKGKVIVGLVDFLSTTSDADVAILIYPYAGRIKFSMRSSEADVADVASHFGGGGHKNAAAFSVPHDGLSFKPHLRKVAELLRSQRSK